MKSLMPVLVLTAAAMLGCASERRLHVEEGMLNTGGPVTSQFHSVLYYPFEITPRFDGYLVGIEKVANPGVAMIAPHNREEYGLKQDALQSKFSDGKTMAITHVVRHFANAQHDKNCTLFNAYVQPKSLGTKQLIAPCDKRAPEAYDPDKAFGNSWVATDILKADIARRISAKAEPTVEFSTVKSKDQTAKPPIRYTHIVVLVMGWNTVQEEAVRNMNSLAWNMTQAYHDPNTDEESGQTTPAARFNPLFIGVTWPSQWSSAWVDPAIKLISFPTKAADADEVGMSWLGVLLHDTLRDVKDDHPIIVIGHSFGAKATSVAACAGPAIARPGAKSYMPLRKIDTVINLQPAFLSERIFGRSSWLQNVIYPSGCPNIKRFVLTASDGDKAVPVPFWGTYMGEGKSYIKFCSDAPKGAPIFSCGTANPAGAATIKHHGSSGIYYINASSLIAENAYQTSGGSHSDIYRSEHGKFIYDIVTRQKDWSVTKPQP